MTRTALRDYLVHRPLSGRLPGRLETAFRSDSVARTLSIKRVALLLGILLYAAFAPLDLLSASETYPVIWLIRFGIVIPAILVALASSYVPRLRKYFYEACAIVVFLSSVGLVLMLVVTSQSEIAHLMYAPGLVLVFLFEVFAGLRFVHAAIINVTVVALYNLLAVGYQGILSFPNGSLLLLNNNYQFVSAAVVSAMQCYLSENIARREFVQRLLVNLEQAEKHRLVQEMAEQKLQERTRILESANQHKSEFLANMSHELRTPLNAVIGFSEVLRERMFGELTPKQSRYVDNIHASGQHLLSLINDILDLSKVEAGRLELDVSLFDVPIALNNAMTLLRERAARHRLTLELVVSATVGEILGDERKFKQIILNLLSNAVKFTPNGGRVRIDAEVKDEQLWVSVADTGVGIAPEHVNAIFEPFRQVGSDVSTKSEGTGLGLSLTKKFIELHGGHIMVESQPGVGSTFSFALPLTRDSHPAAQASPANPGGSDVR